jgi:NADPH:quinone reductase
MKAIRIEQYGGPEVLQRVDIAIPSPGPDDVLIRVGCAGINFMDIHTRQGKYKESRTYPVRLPCTLGMEGAGEVVEAGANVASLKRGDRVAWCISWGAYAEYAVVPASRVARIPSAISFDLAAAAIFQGSTAHYLLEDVAHLDAGSTCLVHAASGGIGQLLVQFAKRRGVTVYATTSSEALRDSFRATRTRGLVVNYGSVSGSLNDLDPIELGEAGSLFLTRPRLADHLADAATVQRRADEIFAALQDGTLKIEISGRYTLDNVEAAHEALESRRQLGKPVMTIG